MGYYKKLAFAREEAEAEAIFSKIWATPPKQENKEMAQAVCESPEIAFRKAREHAARMHGEVYKRESSCWVSYCVKVPGFAVMVYSAKI